MAEIESEYFRPAEWVKSEYEQRFGELLARFCYEFQASFGLEQFTLDDLRKETQSTFYAAMTYIYEHTFDKDNYILKSHTFREHTHSVFRYTTGDMYNYDVIADILEIYIKYCELLNKIPDQNGFIKLTGISYNTLNSWHRLYINSGSPNINNNIYSDGNSSELLNTKKMYIIQKLKLSKQAALEARTTDGKQNPVGCIAILNNEFYNIARPETGSDNRLSALADLPQLAEIVQNDGN